MPLLTNFLQTQPISKRLVLVAGSREVLGAAGIARDTFVYGLRVNNRL